MYELKPIPVAGRGKKNHLLVNDSFLYWNYKAIKFCYIVSALLIASKSKIIYRERVKITIKRARDFMLWSD